MPNPLGFQMGSDDDDDIDRLGKVFMQTARLVYLGAMALFGGTRTPQRFGQMGVGDKEYRILNLADDRASEIRGLYLCARLLSFYQQLRHYKDRSGEFARFLRERPLAIFVGGSVNAVRNAGGREVSDVTEVLLFFKDFIGNDAGKSVDRLERLLNYDGSLRAQKGKPVFGSGWFDYLNAIDLTARQAYAGILDLVFNSPFQAALRVDLLKGSDGEPPLRLGDNEPFGVINVGGAPKLHDLCEKSGMVTEVKQFGGSVFARLKAHEMSLKRSSMLELNPRPYKSIRC